MFQVVRQPPGAVPLDGSQATSTTDATADPRADPTADSTGETKPRRERPAAADALLGELAARLEHGSRAQVLRLGADPRARAELATVLSNVRVLRVTDLSLRYVSAVVGRSSVPVRAGGAGRAPARIWTGDVQVRWRLRGFDTRPARLQVPITFAEQRPKRAPGAPDGDGDGGTLERGPARFVTAGQGRPDEPVALPLWLQGSVSATRTDRSLVVTAQGRPAARYSRLADQAVADVRRVLPRWTGRLVVEVPRGPAELARVLGSDPSDYAQIAAVTTTEDGSARATAPVHVFVNPRVLDPLGPHGAQIVMSHEATHVATGAALSAMPPWLLEGFADYVALDHVDLPVQVTASQILGQVRAHGTPADLPDRADFGARRSGLGAAYESAWLACRLLGEAYGERRLVRFYGAVNHGASTATAFRTVLGTDQRTFTDAWRRELDRLAG